MMNDVASSDTMPALQIMDAPQANRARQNSAISAMSELPLAQDQKSQQQIDVNLTENQEDITTTKEIKMDTIDEEGGNDDQEVQEEDDES